MEKQSIIFLGSKTIGYQCFQFLIEKASELNIEIVGLLTNENTTIGKEFSLIKLANQNQISIYESPDSIPNADILYSVQYHKILKEKEIKKAKKIAINLHMAPLPEYRGCNQFSFAIAENKKEFGVSIHQMDSRIDHGDILFEKRFPIPENCWIEQLYKLSFDVAFNLFKETILSIVQGQYELISQENLKSERGSSLHFRNEIQNLKQIDLSWSKEKIERTIRATSMPGFEPPYAIIDNKKFYFCKEWE